MILLLDGGVHDRDTFGGVVALLIARRFSGALVIGKLTLVCMDGIEGIPLL